jgi:predicted RNA-binding protein YlxR (DUF448 family)
MMAFLAPKGPIRTCISCRESARKEDLLRIVEQENRISIDLIGIERGRGRYVHVTERCIKVSEKRLQRANSFLDFRNRLLVIVEEQLKKDRSAANRFGWLNSAGLVSVTNKITDRIQTLETWTKQIASTTTSGC